MNDVKPTVFLVDDDAAVRKAIGRLLLSVDVSVEKFASAQEFLHRLPFDGIGCLLLDLRMPESGGLELQAALQAIGSHLPVIFISAHADVPASVRAIKAGALDFLQKPFMDTELLEAIEHALAECRKRLAERDLLAELQARFESLTARESEVLTGVIAGKLNKQIAQSLGTVEKTIKVHRARVMEKMGAASVADLVRLTQKIGIHPDES